MYTIDREADTPLYMQIRDKIIGAIDSAKLTPGDKLPPVSALAKEIGVTQATVRRALQDLGKAGYTECHVGRGTFVRDASVESLDQQTDAPEQESMVQADRDAAYPGSQNPLHFATQRLRSGVKKALFDIMPLAHKPGIIKLTRGIPDSDLLPAHFLEEITKETLSGGSKKFIQATDEFGNSELRQEIARRFNEDGNNITAESVLITNGSIQGITLVAQSMIGKKSGVICETPCFQGITDSFSAMGHWVETVRRDQEGPIIEKLNRNGTKDSRLLYLCPYAHNPTGTDLSAERYDKLVEWARKTGSVILADEIFKDLCFAESPLPSLYQKLGGEQTIVVSSLSKSVMTGLRLGWIISSPERIRELAQLKRLMDHAAPSLIQGIALTILTSGKYEAHIESMKVLYQKRMKTMLHALQTHMPKGVTWSNPVGGFSILVELPQGYSSVALLLSAIDRGVSFLPGPLFDIDQRYLHALRLSTAWSDALQIKEGVELLASAIDNFMQQPPEDSGLSGLGNFQ
jgi:DNA-binding transcriptional MocR family regulator